jgi:general stress protein 26
MNQSVYRQQQFSKLSELIKDIRIAMLTTIDDDGSLRSRPMVTPQQEFEGTLCFFVGVDAPMVEESQHHNQVNVSFADPERQQYVSISGTATLVRDRQRMQEIWSPWVRPWFPRGLDDPNLALLQVGVEKAEYWDVPSSTMVQLYGVVKATLTGQPPRQGENTKLIVDERQAGA